MYWRVSCSWEKYDASLMMVSEAWPVTRDSAAWHPVTSSSTVTSCVPATPTPNTAEHCLCHRVMNGNMASTHCIVMQCLEASFIYVLCVPWVKHVYPPFPLHNCLAESSFKCLQILQFKIKLPLLIQLKLQNRIDSIGLWQKGNQATYRVFV